METLHEFEDQHGQDLRRLLARCIMALIAPGDRHMMVVRHGRDHAVRLIRLFPCDRLRLGP